MKHLSLITAICALAACDTFEPETDEIEGTAGNGAQQDVEVEPKVWVVEEGPLEGSCPSGFTAQQGNNTGFPSEGVNRQFHVFLPDDTSTLRPVFVALTGTEQEELDFVSQSGLDQLTDSGWIVVSPYRRCSTEERKCNLDGTKGTDDGRVWEPWYDTTFMGSIDEGPDVRFVEEAVRCMAESWPIDAARIYTGGISAGGTFSNRNLTFNSDFFAGGIPSSGNWSGSVHPVVRTDMEGTIVIQIWGGETDKYMAGAYLVDYGPQTKEAGFYYANQPNVVSISCSGDHGHVWPANLDGTLGNEITNWAAQTLLSHPQGTDPADFDMPEPPAGLRCVMGAYTDH